MTGETMAKAKVIRRAALIVLCMVGLPELAVAASDPSTLCEVATSKAARETGVPLAVLQAVALTESGRSAEGGQRPWPWAVNFGGQGYWFASAEEAELAIAERQSMGATNFDVGCFQLNHRWHGDAFASVATMMDPTQNAAYAAAFLRQLYEEAGTWEQAVAAYHSRTPEYAERYLAKFETFLKQVEGQKPSAVRVNGFPLLQAGTPGGLGSLVPQLAGGISLIGGAP